MNIKPLDSIAYFQILKFTLRSSETLENPNIWARLMEFSELKRIFFLANRSEAKNWVIWEQLMNWRSKKNNLHREIDSVSHDDEDAPSVCQFLISMKTFRNWCMPSEWKLWNPNGSSSIIFTVPPAITHTSKRHEFLTIALTTALTTSQGRLSNLNIH